MKRLLALLAITVVYISGIAVAKLFGFLIPKRTRKTGIVLVIGTFHNPNWFLAHISPLGSCGIKEVIVVGDGFSQHLPNVNMVVPSPWVASIMSRSVAKFFWAFWCAVKYRPDLYMGYAIFPAATWALILARIFGRPCCFQLTSGKLELEGGGYHAENRLLSSLGHPSRIAEKLAFALTRQFDLIVVRGSKAEQYVRQLGFAGKVSTITGSVQVPEVVRNFQRRDLDLIYVARLTTRKRPDRFVEIVNRVAKVLPGVRAAIVGDGPEAEAIKCQIRDHNLTDNVEMLGLRRDVQQLVGQSRLFVLTSRWEGLSIALLEAMSAAAVPVASDVGDLADIVVNEDSGFLCDENDLECFVNAIVRLLTDSEMWTRYSDSARHRATEKSSIESVRQQWRETLSDYVRI